MSKTPDTDRQSNEPPRSLGISRVEIHLLHPVRLLVESFTGPCAEQDADDYLHRASLNLARQGQGVVVAVTATLEDGRCFDGIHLLRYGDTEGSIRSHKTAAIDFLLRHVACPIDGQTVAQLRSLKAALQRPCAGRYTFQRLVRLHRKPRDVDGGREFQSGRSEHHAALFSALMDGVTPEGSARRAARVAYDLAPRGPAADEYRAGVEYAVDECRRVLARRPLRSRRNDSGDKNHMTNDPPTDALHTDRPSRPGGADDGA